MIKPISPDEVKNEIPDYVIEVFNKLIKENWNGHSSTILLKDVCNLLPNCKRAHFNVEDLYRSHGWKVKYDQPGYNESYNAYFVFSKDK